jgi:hypothetical protein
MASFGNGSGSYTARTTREYLRRVRESLDFHRHTTERLARLESRYQKILAHKYNEKSQKNQ